MDAQAVGAVCQGDVFCQSGLCALTTSQTCEATKGLNELCTRDIDCGDDGYCDDAPPDVQRCVSKTLLGLGERCGLGAATCGDGLVCEDGLCVTRAGIGGPCLHDGYCPSSGWCDGGSCEQRAPIGGMCAGDNQCVAIAWCSAGVCTQRIEANQSCEQGDRCAAGTYCQLEVGVVGTCQPLPGAGSDCLDGACSTGLVCATYAGTCAAALAAGADCQTTAMCAADHLCQSPGLAGSVCQAPEIVGAGELCGNTEVMCGNGLYCGGGVCQAYAVAGTPCGEDESCVAGTSCVEGLCDSLGGAFATCDTPGDCAAGHYCDLLYQQCTPQKAMDQASRCTPH